MALDIDTPTPPDFCPGDEATAQTILTNPLTAGISVGNVTHKIVLYADNVII